MAKINASDIPENKFAEVTIGNNGVRITQEIATEIRHGIVEKKEVSIYIRKEDIMEIFTSFISMPGEHLDGIETVYLDAESVDMSDDEDDSILDAVY